MKYYISDLHLCHKNCIRFDDRPFADIDEMHREIVKRWNRKITNADEVYILGDLSMRGKKEEVISLISTLKGKKTLIRGNHDMVGEYRYQQLFEEVCDYKTLQDSVDGKNYNLVLFHYPIFSWKNMGRGTILLYGHTHNSEEDYFYQKCLQEMREKHCRHIYQQLPQAYNVGCMKLWMNYEPRTLKEIMENYKRIMDENILYE